MSVLPYLYFSKLRIREGLKIRLWNDKRSPICRIFTDVSVN